MSRHRPNRRNRIAFHEAGHAVAAELLASRLSDGDSAHFVELVLPAVDVDPEARARLDAHVMLSLAGAVAEAFFAGCEPSACKVRPPESGIPLEVLTSTMEAEEARRYTAWLERRTWNLLERHWSKVEARARQALEPAADT